jgi:hypothetical protein
VKNNRGQLAKTTGQKIRNVRSALPPVASRFKRPSTKIQTEEALENVPRITNETVAEHREKILKGGRKYRYPLEHSKHKIVVVSTALLTLGIIAFVVSTCLSLYRYHSTSLFMYRVTQVVPFPVAKAGKNWVSYESYLFELRRYVHYYETQQKVDFTSESGKLQLAMYRPKAMEQVVNDAYVKELAHKNGVTVSDRDVEDAITMLRIENQLGGNNKELASVTKKFFGWSLNDLRRELKQELLAQKLAATLDKAAFAQAEQILAQLRTGSDFVALAAQVSDDATTKANGGQYTDAAITLNSQEVPPVVVRALATLKPGELSNVITTPTAFEIVKLLSVEDGKYKAAHIQVQFKDIKIYIDPLKKSEPPQYFIKTAS